MNLNSSRFTAKELQMIPLEFQSSLDKRDHLEFSGDHIMLMLLELDRNSKAEYLSRPVCCEK